MGRIVKQIGNSGGLRRRREQLNLRPRRQEKEKEQEDSAYETFSKVAQGARDIGSIVTSPLTMPIAYGIDQLIRSGNNPEAPLTPEEQSNADSFKKWMHPQSAGAPSKVAEEEMQKSADRLARKMEAPFLEIQDPLRQMGRNIEKTYPLSAYPDAKYLPKNISEEWDEFRVDYAGLGETKGGASSPAVRFRNNPGFETTPLGAFSVPESEAERLSAIQAMEEGREYIPQPSYGPSQVQEAALREIRPDLAPTQKEINEFLKGYQLPPEEMIPAGPMQGPMQSPPQEQAQPSPFDFLLQDEPLSPENAMQFLRETAPKPPELASPDALNDMGISELAQQVKNAPTQEHYDYIRNIARNKAIPRNLGELLSGAHRDRVDNLFAKQQRYKDPKITGKDALDVMLKSESLKNARDSRRRAKELEAPNLQIKQTQADMAKLKYDELFKKVNQGGRGKGGGGSLFALLRKARKAANKALPNGNNAQKTAWILNNPTYKNLEGAAYLQGAQSDNVDASQFDSATNDRKFGWAKRAFFELSRWKKTPKLARERSDSGLRQKQFEAENKIQEEANEKERSLKKAAEALNAYSPGLSKETDAARISPSAKAIFRQAGVPFSENEIKPNGVTEKDYVANRVRSHINKQK